MNKLYLLHIRFGVGLEAGVVGGRRRGLDVVGEGLREEGDGPEAVLEGGRRTVGRKIR